MDFKLGGMALGLEPFGEGAFELVVAVDSEFSCGACGGVLCVVVEWFVAHGSVVVVVACCGGGVVVDTESGFEGCGVVEFGKV